MNKCYYIRRNSTKQLPRNLLFLDCETTAERIDTVDLHRMSIAWLWRLTLGSGGNIARERWTSYTDSQELYDYIAGECRAKAPLYVIGSNITFDLFATSLLEHMEVMGWICEVLYDQGLVTILIASHGEKKVKFLAAQNWLAGGVPAWGEMLDLPKLKVDFDSDTPEAISAYCRRDVEITGRAVLGYLDFLRAHDMGGFALTAAGQAYRCFRHRFMKRRSILHYDKPPYNKFVRAAYAGGRVECGRIGTLTGDFTKLDINSMYPHVMREYTYPAKIRQWTRTATVDTIRDKIGSLCCIAEVELDTPEPAYAVKEGSKLLFPVGDFSAFLCTGSLRYALERGHITKVRQLMTFTPARLFTGYVDHFYPLKAEYRAQGNKVWTQIVKIMLNSLYGKFGEKHSREISREHIPKVATSRIAGLYSVDALEDAAPAFDWRSPDTEHPEPELVPGVCWSLLNTQVTEVGADEGSGSAPAIAAHVTDYARMLLYYYMRLIGLEKVLYADTDSLIIDTDNVEALKGYIDRDKLGSLKVEGQANTLSIRGAKDYSFGRDSVRKGIRASAQRICRRCREKVADYADRCGFCGDHLRIAAFTQDAFPGFYSLLRRGLLGGFPLGTTTKVLSGIYSKGTVGTDGRVRPLRMTGGKPSDYRERR